MARTVAASPIALAAMLERLPGNRLDRRRHETSFSAGALAPPVVAGLGQWANCEQAAHISACLAGPQGRTLGEVRSTTHVDGLPVRGGVVSIVGADITAATDACGAYVLRVPRSAVRAKQIPMKVEAEGLQTKVTSVAVTAPTVTANVALSLGFHRAGYRWIPCGGAEAEKAVPVDVISRDQIAASGYAETTQLIESMVPSFNAPTTNVLNVAAADAFILRCPSESVPTASGLRPPAAIVVWFPAAPGQYATSANATASLRACSDS